MEEDHKPEAPNTRKCISLESLPDIIATIQWGTDHTALERYAQHFISEPCATEKLGQLVREVGTHYAALYWLSSVGHS